MTPTGTVDEYVVVVPETGDHSLLHLGADGRLEFFLPLAGREPVQACVRKRGTGETSEPFPLRPGSHGARHPVEWP